MLIRQEYGTYQYKFQDQEWLKNPLKLKAVPKIFIREKPIESFKIRGIAKTSNIQCIK